MAFNGSASSVGIGLAIFLDDHFSKTANVVKGVMENLGHEAKSLENHLNNLHSFGSGLESIGMGLIGVAKKGVDAFASYDHIMNSVRVISQIPKDQAKQMRTELDQLNMELAVRYGVLPDAIGKAQLELAKAGKKGQEIKNMTEAVTALGAATDTQVDGANGAAEVLVNVMQAYGAASTEAHKYAAILTSAANQSTIDVKDFYQSMRYSADVAHTLGVSIEETAAVMATLGNAGLKGSNAGTTYANMLRYLSTALSEFRTNRQSASLKALGLDSKDFFTEAGEIKDMTEVLQNLRTAMQGMTRHQQTITTQGLFGVRGNRALPLIKSIVEAQEGIYSFEDNLQKIIADRDSNAHQKQAIERQDSLQGDLNRLSAAWQTMWIRMGESIEPMLRNIIPKLIKVVDKVTEVMSSPFMGKLLMAMTSTGVLAVIAGKLIQGVAGFGMFLINFNNNFRGMIQMFNTIQTTHKRVLKLSASEMLTSAKMMLQAAQRNILAAQGMTARNAVGGGTLIQGRDAKGRFTKGIKANWFARFLGMFGGFKGVRAGMRITEWFVKLGAKIMAVAPWLTKLGAGLAKFWGVLKFAGRAIWWLGSKMLSWWYFLADMVVTMITGKSILEWGWELLKGMFNQAGELGNVFKSVGDFLWGWVSNIATLGVAGLFTDGKWGGRIGDDLSSWIGSGHVSSGTAEDKAWWDKINNKPYEYKGPENPLMFNGGQLVQPEAKVITPYQLDPKDTITKSETKVIEKQKHTLNLTINAPASGSFQQQINLDDDRALLGSAVI